MTETQELEAGAAALGVPLEMRQLQSLARFAGLLRRWNEAFNLISRADVARLIPRHLLDALSLAPLVRGARVLDLGSGAGLPGIPLAIARADVEFCLLDRSERRIRFIRHAKIELGLENVTPVVADFADFRPDILFDTVLSRAVARPVSLWQIAANLLTPRGIALFQVGSQEREADGLAANVEPLLIRIPGLTRPHQVLRVSARAPASEGPKQDTDR